MKNQTENSHNFWLNYMIDDKISAKIIKSNAKFKPLLVVLKPSNYCSVHFTIGVIIAAFSQDPEKERIIKRKLKNELEIRINADYDRLLQADERETLQIIAETYLKAIEIFLLPRKDFEGKKFYEDVKNLFVKEGILKKIE